MRKINDTKYVALLGTGEVFAIKYSRKTSRVTLGGSSKMEKYLRDVIRKYFKRAIAPEKLVRAPVMVAWNLGAFKGEDFARRIETLKADGMTLTQVKQLGRIMA